MANKNRRSKRVFDPQYDGPTSSEEEHAPLRDKEDTKPVPDEVYSVLQTVEILLKHKALLTGAAVFIFSIAGIAYKFNSLIDDVDANELNIGKLKIGQTENDYRVFGIEKDMSHLSDKVDENYKSIGQQESKLKDIEKTLKTVELEQAKIK